MKNVICFDIGGTFIKYGVVNEEGTILCNGKFPSPQENCKEVIPEVLSVHIKELQKRHDVDAVGISTAGQVDSENGIIIFASDNLPGYTGATLSGDIERMTGLPCFVENDVNAVALGEMWKGAGRGRKTFVCIALGTGIGGAIVIDGKLVRGIRGGAGEIGHMIVNEKGVKCTCGSSGCYERYASTAALIRCYKERMLQQGNNVDHVDGEYIMTQVKAEETDAVEIYNAFLDHIVTGLVSVTHLLDPGLIILGGGISAQGEPFFTELNKRFKEKVIPAYGEYTTILQAELQNNAGILGAGYFAFSRMAR